jgi:hypothetical protein
MSKILTKIITKPKNMSNAGNVSTMEVEKQRKTVSSVFLQG